MNWYAARTIYLFGDKPDGKNIYEERIVVFNAIDFEEAHIKAKKESRLYAQDNGFEAYKEQVIYQQDGKNLIEAYEVWSELYESDKSLAEFYQAKYQSDCYNADE